MNCQRQSIGSLFDDNYYLRPKLTCCIIRNHWIQYVMLILYDWIDNSRILLLLSCIHDNIQYNYHINVHLNQHHLQPNLTKYLPIIHDQDIEK